MAVPAFFRVINYRFQAFILSNLTYQSSTPGQAIRNDYPNRIFKLAVCTSRVSLK
jgi:hypothetical protein